jgi:hypothetical protein
MGQEETPANFLDCTTEAGLVTLLGGVTVVDN